VQIALGMFVAGGLGRGVELDPDLFFVLFLPPLLFIDGWRIPNTGLLRDKRIILQLALGLVVFTVLGAGLFIHWLIPAMPLALAFALAAILSPTDPVAVNSIAGKVPIPRRLMHILEGEALLNDATGLVCFRFALAAALTGQFSMLGATLTFLWVALAGVAVGAGVTLGVSWAQGWLDRRLGDEAGTPILVNLLIPFGAYLLAELVHASGILAAVAAGLTMSYVELNGKAQATTRVQRAAVWDTVHLALNGTVFVLLGEQLPDIWTGAQASLDGNGPVWRLVAHAVIICAGLALLRFLWVWVSLRLERLSAKARGQAAPRAHWLLVLATSLAGVRGALTLAAVLTLPRHLDNGRPFPHRELLIFIAAAVIILSMLVAVLVLPRVLARLEMPDDPTDDIEEDRARHHAAKAAIAAVRSERHRVAIGVPDDRAYARALGRIVEMYERRLPDEPANARDAAHQQQVDLAERALRLAALNAEREAVFELARRGEISDQTARRLVHEIDLLEARYRPPSDPV
jgi:CPA1 family monovalent cation:H+ antiporter